MEIALHLEYKADVPLYRRLSDALRKAILDGRLKPGQRMPSVRDLCGSLRISRATVLRSLDDLQKQGYVSSSPRAGAFVSKVLPGALIPEVPAPLERAEPVEAKEPARLSAYGNRLLESERVEQETSYLHEETNYGGPPLSLIPLKEWRELLLRHCRRQDFRELEYLVDPFGYLPLREAVVSYLSRTRGLYCTSEQVMVFAGRQFRMDIVARVLLDPGDHIGVENPGFSGFRHVAASRGAISVPIPVDDEGISVEHLSRCPYQLKLLYVTPSHHDPLGIVMSLGRRRELLAWAQSRGTFVIEDDFDCEYHWEGPALPALQGLDGGGTVIHECCFSKVLFPLVRLGFLVVPRHLVPIMAVAKSRVERDVALLEQYALTDLINEGILERQIRKTEEILDRRRRALVEALRAFIPAKLHIPYSSSGMYFIVHIESHLSDEELAARALTVGLPLVSTKPYYMGAHRTGEFMLYFANLEVQTVERAVKQFALSVGR